MTHQKLLSSTASFSKPITKINPKKWLETRIRTVSWYEKNSNGEWKRCWRSIEPEDKMIQPSSPARPNEQG